MKANWTTSRGQIAAIGATGAAALGVVAFLPHQFWPKCPVYALTGLYCPGCGGLRATWDLLHGNLAGAINQNAIIFAIPVMVLAVLYAENTGKPVLKRVMVTISLVIAVGFTILRNLPGSWLAPDPIGI